MTQLSGNMGNTLWVSPVHDTVALIDRANEHGVEADHPDAVVGLLQANGLIDAVARQAGRGVLACGNFALTVVLLQRFAEMAARLIRQWEIIDYAHDDKPDAPSGTARELAARLARVQAPDVTVPIAETSDCQQRAAPSSMAHRSTQCGCPALSLARKSFSA